jgi:D-amino peptidase
MNLQLRNIGLVLVLICFSTLLQAGSGYTLEAPVADSDGKIRVLLYHDMEGLAGQDDWRTAGFYQKEHYPKGQKFLIDDVNAVVAGLFDAGADEVHVVDAHGSGNPDPDVRADLLDPRAKQLWRDKPFHPYVDLSDPGVYDAVVAVGMHAKIGSNGFISHTYSLGTDIILNGMSITETELIAFSFGRIGVPVIFVSGDDRLKKDLATMPWIKYAQVKQAENAYTIKRLVPVAEAHADMRKKAALALGNLDNMKVMRLTAPVAAALRVVSPATLESLANVPGIHYSTQANGQRVDFIAADFRAAYDGIIALIGVSGAGRISVIMETIASQPNHEALMTQFLDNLYQGAFEVESGERQAGVNSPPPAQRYHGVK